MPTRIGILVTIYTGIYCVGMRVYKFGCESTPCLFVCFFLTYDILSKLAVKYPDDVYVAQRVRVMFCILAIYNSSVHHFGCAFTALQRLLNARSPKYICSLPQYYLFKYG